MPGARSPGPFRFLRDFSKNIDHKKSRAPCIASAALRSQSRDAFAKSKDPNTSTRSKEIVMNTDKVIELGKVSEETKGVAGIFEQPGALHKGPEG
jgi:hypothetical protein